MTKPTYSTTIRGKWIYGDAQTIDQMIDALLDQVNELKAFKDAGVELDADGAQDDYFFFRTEDAEVAKKLGFYEDEDEGEEE